MKHLLLYKRASLHRDYIVMKISPMVGFDCCVFK